jgi:hypothetical protein
METDEASTSVSGNMRLRGAKSALTPLLPEVDCYLHLLVLLHLLDAGAAHKEAAVVCSENLVRKLLLLEWTAAGVVVGPMEWLGL